MGLRHTSTGFRWANMELCPSLRGRTTTYCGLVFPYTNMQRQPRKKRLPKLGGVPKKDCEFEEDLGANGKNGPESPAENRRSGVKSHVWRRAIPRPVRRCPSSSGTRSHVRWRRPHARAWRASRAAKLRVWWRAVPCSVERGPRLAGRRPASSEARSMPSGGWSHAQRKTTRIWRSATAQTRLHPRMRCQATPLDARPDTPGGCDACSRACKSAWWRCRSAPRSPGSHANRRRLQADAWQRNA